MSPVRDRANDDRKLRLRPARNDPAERRGFWDPGTHRQCPMNADPTRTTHHWTADFTRPLIDLSEFHWYLRWKLSRISSDIDEIEHRSIDAFGRTETALLNAEHIALLKKREALICRLTHSFGRP